MIIGIPKETKDHEYRVGLTPEAVRDLTRSGHTVLVEKSAGEGSGYPDENFEKAGGRIVADRAHLFSEAELLVKVKEPVRDEWTLLREGQTLVSFLHLAANRELTEGLLERGVTAVSYETVQLSSGVLPILRPMSEVAGRMATLVGAYYLQKKHGGSGILLPGVPGVSPARVVILGGGTVGTSAARIAIGLGAQVTLFHLETERLRHLDDLFQGRIITRVAHPELIEQSVLSADLLIGAVLLPGAKTPRLVARRHVRGMRKGSVIVDVSVDQGGCVETSRPTTHSDPIYLEEGILHYCVSNMPGAYPRTSTMALVNESFGYVSKMASLGVEKACQGDPALRAGLNIRNGKITHPAVAEAHGMKCED
jgi:alanine dehydrogenase